MERKHDSTATALLPLALILLLLPGCLGGGTLATGIGEGFGGSATSPYYGMRVITVRGRLMDAQQRPLSGIKVTAVSSAGAAEAFSDRDGNFEFALEAVPYSRLELNFESSKLNSRVFVDAEDQDLMVLEFVLGQGKARPRK